LHENAKEETSNVQLAGTLACKPHRLDRLLNADEYHPFVIASVDLLLRISQDVEAIFDMPTTAAFDFLYAKGKQKGTRN
jgi:hypothetical protein